MKIRITPNSYFSVNSKHMRIKYAFEKMDPGHPDYRKALISSFAISFLQDLDILEDIHRKICSSDPETYVKLCKFVLKSMSGGSISETNFLKPFCVNSEKSIQNRQIFLAHLLSSENPELRKTGTRIIPDMSPDALAEAVNYCKRVYGKFPGSAVTAIKTYLRELEKDDSKFDLCLFEQKKHLKFLYSSLHIRPSERAQKIIFENDPPTGSLAETFRIFRNECNSDILCERAELFGISPDTALKSIRFFSQKTAKKLIEKMDTSQVISCIDYLRSKGLEKDEEISALIRKKLKKLPLKRKESDIIRVKKYIPKSPTSFKSLVYSCVLSLIKKGRSIRKKLALLIDNSSSMYAHKDEGKAFINILSSLLSKEGSLNVIMFAEKASELNINDSKWEETYDSSFASESGTSPGSAFSLMADKGIKPDVAVIVTDGNENSGPSFSEGYSYFADKTGIMPYAVLVKAGYFSNRLERGLQTSDMSYFVSEFSDCETSIDDIGSFIFSESFENSLNF